MRSLLFLIISFSSISFYSQLSDSEILAKKDYTSIASAKGNGSTVYRLTAHDYDEGKHAFVLKEFSNLTALDISGTNATFLPFGIKKLKNLQYLNLSETEVTYIYSGLKKLPNLKVLVLINAKVPASEINKLVKKKGIKVITNIEDLPKVFTPRNNTENNTTTTNLQSNKNSNTTTNNKPENNSNKTTTATTTNSNNEEEEERLSIEDELGSYYTNNLRYNKIEAGQEKSTVSLTVYSDELEQFISKIDVFESLASLTILDVSYIPKALSKLKTLRKLHIYSTKSIQIPDLNLSNLVYLYLPQTNRIPDWIYNNKELYYFSYYSKSNAVLPKISAFIELRLLSIMSCNLSEQCSSGGIKTTNGIEQLTFLEELSIHSKENIVVTTPFGTLEKLTYFDIKLPAGKTVTLPESFGNLSALTTFKAQTKTFPTSFKKLIKLKTLDYMTTNDKAIRATNFNEILPYLINLERLCLEVNANVLDFSQNTKLRHIYLYSENGKTPLGLSNLKKLKYLEFWNFDFNETIPASLCKLETLKTLRIHKSNIKTIPVDIIGLKNIKLLNLNRNEITNIPSFLFNLESNELTNLKEVRLHLNPVTKTKKDRELNTFLKSR